MRDHRRVFLQVVGRQPMIFVPDDRFKEAPGASRDYARGAKIFGSQLPTVFHQPPADIESNQR